MSQVIGDLLLRIGPDEAEYQKIDEFLTSAEAGLEGLQAVASATSLESVTAGAQALGAQLDLFSKSAETAAAGMEQLTLFDVNSIAATDEVFGSLAQTATQVGTAAAAAAPEIEATGAAAQHAGEAAHEAEGGLAAMAEQLSVLAEALVITEGLHEFAAEALEVFSKTQDLATSLGFMSGNAEEAEGQVELLKQKAIEMVIPFEQVAATAQKMAAQLGGLDNALPLMQAAADASHVMGTSFESAANSMDRLVLSGNVAAKSLVSLGLSTGDLAAVMGVADGQVKATFKDLDESQRIEVLVAALGKYAGASAEFAHNLSGEWTNFQNQFDQVMDEIGKALAPLATEFLDVLNQIVPMVKGAVDQFNALPEPVKDVALAVGVLAAAIVPLTAGLAAWSLAAAGLETLMPAVTAAIGTFGTTAAEVAVEETTAAEATVALGEAATTATGAAGGSGLLGLVGALGEFGPLLVAAGGAFLVTEGQIDTLKQKYDDFIADLKKQEILQYVSLGKTIDDLKELGFTIDQVKAAVGGLNKAFDDGSTFVTNFDAGVVLVTDKIKTSSEGFKLASGALGDLLNNTQKINDWKAALDIATDALRNHSITLTQYNAVLAEYNKALTSLQAKPLADSIGAVDEAAGKLNKTLVEAQATFDKLNAGYAAGTTTDAQLGEALKNLTAAQEANNKVVDLAIDKNKTVVDTFKELTDAMAAGTISVDDYAKAIEAATTDSEEFVQEVNRVSTNMVDVNGTARLVSDALGTVDVATGKVVNGVTVLTGSVQDGTAKLNAYGLAAGEAASKVVELGGAVTDAAGAVRQANADWDAAATKAQGYSEAMIEATKDVSNFMNANYDAAASFSAIVSGAQDAMKAVQDYEAAANNAAQGSNILGGTGLGGFAGGKGQGAGAVLSTYASFGATDNELAGVAAMFGLIQVGQRSFETLAEYNAQLKASGSQFQAVMNQAGQIVLEFTGQVKSATTAVQSHTSATQASTSATQAGTAATGDTTINMRLLGSAVNDTVTPLGAFITGVQTAADAATAAAAAFATAQQAADATYNAFYGVTTGVQHATIAIADMTGAVQKALGAFETAAQAADATYNAFYGVTTGVQLGTIAMLDLTTATQGLTKSFATAQQAADALYNSFYGVTTGVKNAAAGPADAGTWVNGAYIPPNFFAQHPFTGNAPTNFNAPPPGPWGGGNAAGGVTINVTGNTIQGPQTVDDLAQAIVNKLRLGAGLKL